MEKLNKKQLYESIMKDVSMIVKKHLNEDAYGAEDELVDLIKAGLESGDLLVYGIYNGNVPVLDVYEVQDYIMNDTDYEVEDVDFFVDDLFDLNVPDFALYDLDTFKQCADGGDGMCDDEGWSADNYIVLDRPVILSKFLKMV